MIDQFQVFDIGRRKKTVALLVLLRAQDIEFRLPKTISEALTSNISDTSPIE